jgi:hypothetical protein
LLLIPSRKRNRHGQHGLGGVFFVTKVKLMSLGFKRRASSKLGVSEFYDGGTDGTGMFAAYIDATGFGFGGGRDDIF